MKVSTRCPCCSSPLLHHFGNHREYWFCRHCWQEMPDLEESKNSRKNKLPQFVSLSTGFSSLNQALAIG